MLPEKNKTESQNGSRLARRSLSRKKETGRNALAGIKSALETVKGAVSKEELYPVLTHLHVYSGRVQGSNGKITIDFPCPELSGFDFTVPAQQFASAIAACESAPKISCDESSLSVKSGGFSVRLPLIEHDSFPRAKPGKPTSESEPEGALIPVLEKLYCFIDTNVSRRWMHGVLIKNGYAWATDNTVLARMPCRLPDMLIPTFAIDELIRLKIEPARIADGDSWIEFRFRGGWWLRCQKLGGEWPDVTSCMPQRPKKPSTGTEQLRTAVEKIAPFFADGSAIQMDGEKITNIDGTAKAEVRLDSFSPSKWTAEHLLLVLKHATHLDTSSYPEACYWVGDSIDGVLVGVE